MRGHDLRTQAFLQDAGLFLQANCYDPSGLKRRVNPKSEWSERFRRNFEHVLADRSMSVPEYERRMDIEFADEATLYGYLSSMYEFIFHGGPLPEIPS